MECAVWRFRRCAQPTCAGHFAHGDVASCCQPLADSCHSGAAEREFSAVEIIQVAILWRVARQAYGLLDIDPLIPQDTAVTGPATAVAEPAPRKKGEDECSSRSIG